VVAGKVVEMEAVVEVEEANVVVGEEEVGGGGGGRKDRRRLNIMEISSRHVNETFLARINSVTTNLQQLPSQNEVLLLKQKMSDLRAIKYANSANPNILEWAIAPITIIFERLAKRSVNPYVDIKRMAQLVNNGMDYKVKYFDETSSYPIIVQTTVLPTTENI
jgi:hypothetical protein